MANSYDILKDFGTDGVLNVSPFWILCVVSFNNQITFSRNPNDYVAQITGSPGTARFGINKVMETTTNIITSDCVAMSTSTNKGSHLSELNATLLPSKDYLNIIYPGDWVMGWMMNDEATFTSVLDRLRSGKEACNEFRDGFKFLGRVQSLRKVASVSSDGTLNTRFMLSGTGFQELDSFVFYDPQLERAFPHWSQFLASANPIMANILSAKGIVSDTIVPALFSLLLGRGITGGLANPSGRPNLQSVVGSVATKDAPFAYLVPNAIGTILGKNSQLNLLSYADLIEMVIGVQKYSATDTRADFTMFLPDGITDQNTSIKRIGSQLVGNYNADTPQFINKSVWTLLNQFINPTINEMYTCLRVNSEGRVVPQIIVRQMPLSGPERARKDATLTAFHEVPRWRITNELLFGYNLGRSDSLRTNFVHLSGQSPMTSSLMATQLARNGVYLDEHDIKRNGLRMDVQTVSAAVESLEFGPRRWMDIRADFVMDMQLTLNGTFNVVGIQAPICEGDNLEFDGKIFHIESVSHNVSVGADGRKDFTTTLTVTHGVNTFANNAPSIQATTDSALLSPSVAPQRVTTEDTYE